jgi:hypothetical protein
MPVEEYCENLVGKKELLTAEATLCRPIKGSVILP